MTYCIVISDKITMHFSDYLFKPQRKKPTISVYDAEKNCETKIASFNSQETFEWFLKDVLGAKEKTDVH